MFTYSNPHGITINLMTVILLASIMNGCMVSHEYIQTSGAVPQRETMETVGTHEPTSDLPLQQQATISMPALDPSKDLPPMQQREQQKEQQPPEPPPQMLPPADAPPAKPPKNSPPLQWTT